MVPMTEIHVCEATHACATRALGYARFNGSLSLTCPSHAVMLSREYGATIYNPAGQEASR